MPPRSCPSCRDVAIPAANALLGALSQRSGRMRSDGDTGEAIRDAVGKRSDFLAALRAEPYRKPALVEELSVSRSTVDRAIDDLVGAGLVERGEDGYRATLNGRLAHDVYREYAGRTDGLAAAGPLLDALPPSTRLAPRVLAGADVEIAEPHAPEGALSRAISTLERSSTLRGFAPVVKTNYVSLIHEAVVENDLAVEIVIEERTRESLPAIARGSEKLHDLLASPAVSMLEVDQTLPYALWLMDTPERAVAGITVHDAGGIVGVATNDRPEAVGWCEELYADVRADATELSPSVLE